MTLRVLFVDPDESLLEAYREFPTPENFQVETSSAGEDCLSKLESWQPDVVVLEPDMDDGWGERILDKVAQSLRVPRPQVIILSRHDRTAFAPPVYAYHVKPISMVELVKSIEAAHHSQKDGAKW